MERKLLKVDESEFRFKNVKLFKTETLGTGSYGAVCKAKCDQLICAAKILYPVLFQMQVPDPGKEHRQPFHRFELECRLLSRINHPNIVQYLGTYHDPETNAPVLLMELMDESLTHFLESSPGDIPYHIQVNLSQDIAQALAFLHANGIIHRDLSSNNVLLIAGSRAKVSDFGMLRFIDTANFATMTQCPGTPAFMSPEALNEPPVYTEKLDTFSMGVLIIQIITRKFPKPADRFRTEQFPNPLNPSHITEALVPIPEVERRQAHIRLIEVSHPLLPTALDCVKDKEVDRPTSQQLCKLLEILKRTDRYEQSIFHSKVQMNGQHVQENLFDIEQFPAQSNVLDSKNAEIQQVKEILEQKYLQKVVTKDTELKQLKKVSEQQIQDRDMQITALNQQLESNQKVIAKLQQKITQYETQVTELRKQLTTDTTMSKLAHTTCTSNDSVWTTLPGPPGGISAGSSAEIGSKIYFKSRDTSIVYELNMNTSSWHELPSHPLADFTIVTVDNMLTTVGGSSENWLGNDKCSNHLYSFSSKKWTKHFPPMTAKRTLPAAISTSNTLVVAGGSTDSGQVTIVETLNIRSKEWSTVSSLPFSTIQASLTICRDFICLHPRRVPHWQDSFKQSVIKCSLGELVNSRPKSAKWRNICSLPVNGSTLVTLNGHLLAVGGQVTSKDGLITKEIYRYNQIADTWEVVSEMIEARHYCLTALLPDNKLLVAGGATSDQTMETATFSELVP